MYSTMLAPRSSLENLAWSHVFKTNRFMLAPSFVPDPARVVGVRACCSLEVLSTLRVVGLSTKREKIWEPVRISLCCLWP
jgi:hypothetical protein